jgi:NitT/TauT family transport system substrate-binding protein
MTPLAQARPRRARIFGIATVAGALAALTVFGGTAGSSTRRAQLTTITVDTLPIANGLPLDLGIKQGFFAAQGIEIKKNVLQSGNDIVLALANHNGEIGYLGYVPMMIARTQGIPIQLVSASEVEGTNAADNWQNIMVKGSSSIRSAADLAGKTIAVNALKGVGEVMIRAALRKEGVNPDSVKLLALPFPAMRTALNNGQIDAFWAPEPFLSQALNLDGDRVVMAPGPVLGRFWPIGGYAALEDWASKNPDLATKFRTAINQSLAYAQSHPDDVRALLPAGTQNVRLPIWSPLVDQAKLVQLAKYTKEYGVISTLPNFAKLIPSSAQSGKTLQATVGANFATLRLDGKVVSTLKAGKYTIVVSDGSKSRAFKLVGPGVRKTTSVKGTGRALWTLTLKKGAYRYSSGSGTRTLRVT